MTALDLIARLSRLTRLHGDLPVRGSVQECSPAAILLVDARGNFHDETATPSEKVREFWISS